MKHLQLVALAILLALGCGDSTEHDPVHSNESTDFDGTINVSDTALSSLLHKMGTKAYTLPTPLQIATILRTYDFPYNQDLVYPPPKEVSHTSNYKRALNLGVNAIDLGYVCVNGHSDLSEGYLKIMEELLRELDINAPVDPTFLERFQSNLSNQDSLSRIILESYSLGNTHFQKEGKEGLGLLIAVGCYIEGLHVLMNTSSGADEEVYNTLLAQQKLFLQALTELLGLYENDPKIAGLSADLNDLLADFEMIQVTYVTSEKGQVQSMGGSVPGHSLDTIRVKIGKLREAAIG